MILPANTPLDDLTDLETFFPFFDILGNEGENAAK
jgi:hypothetical protein